MRVPRRLRREPLLEAAWLIRYELAEPNDLLVLPGALYAQLQEYFPVLERKVDLPLFAHYFLPPLRNLPFLQMRDENAKWFLEITPELIILRNQKSYMGWEKFSAQGKHITQTVKKLPFIRSITGGSLRYMDFFHKGLLPDPTPLSVLSMHISLGEENIGNNLTNLRWQKRHDPFTIAFALLYPAEVWSESGKMEGLLLQIETSFPMPDASLEQFINRMQQAHQIGHEAFFRLLHSETLQALEPEYD